MIMLICRNVVLCLLVCAPVSLSAQDAKPEKAEPAKVPVAEQLQKLDVELGQTGKKVQANKIELADLQRQQFDLTLKLKHIEGELSQLEKTRQESRHKIESILKEEGSWVSFSRQIAPILRDRCLTCHNARNPQGQYIVANYANAIGTGESGAVVVPGKADASRLYQFLADHSMPQESQALTADQIATFKKWIDGGARLDADAEPDVSIFRLAPRAEQITPPDQYPANIPITAIAVPKSGDLIATSGYHELLLWSGTDGKLVRRIRGVGQRVNAICFLADGKRVAVASGTPGRVGEARVFNAENGEPVADLLFCQDSALCISSTADGKRLAVGETSGAISVFSVKDDKFEQLCRIEDHSDWVNHLSWSSTGKLIASASRDKTCKVYEAETGKLQITFNGHEQPVSNVLFSADDRQLVSVGEDRKIRIWNIDEAKQLHELKGVDGHSIFLRLNKKQSVAIGREGGVILFDSEANKVKQLESLGALVGAGCLSRDGSKILFGTFDGQVQAIEIAELAKSESLFQAVPFASKP